MKFTKEYSKLKNTVFTTIRKYSGYYNYGGIYKIDTPEQTFKARVIALSPLHKDEIDNQLARIDADCSREELIGMLEKWYGEDFDDFMIMALLRLRN